MRETLIAEYKRDSTLWKNANAYYVAHDWVLMECLFADYSDDRKNVSELGMRAMNKKTGEDITEEYVTNNLFDRYTIRFTNKRGNNTESHSFRTKEEANEFFKKVMRDKTLKNFRKAG